MGDVHDSSMESVSKETEVRLLDRLSQYADSEGVAVYLEDGETGKIAIIYAGENQTQARSLMDDVTRVGQLRFHIADRSEARSEVFRALANQPKPDAWPDARTVANESRVVSTDLEVLQYMVGRLEEQASTRELLKNHRFGYEAGFVDPRDPQLSPIYALSAEQEKIIIKQDRFGRETMESDGVTRAQTLHYLFEDASLRAEKLQDAFVDNDISGRPVVNLHFSEADGKRFYELTKAHTHEALAIMVDDVVYSAPIIMEPIPGGRVQISFGSSYGALAKREAEVLTHILRNEPLPCPLENNTRSSSLRAADVPTMRTVSVRFSKRSMRSNFRRTQTSVRVLRPVLTLLVRLLVRPGAERPSKKNASPRKQRPGRRKRGGVQSTESTVRLYDLSSQPLPPCRWRCRFLSASHARNRCHENRECT